MESKHCNTIYNKSHTLLLHTPLRKTQMFLKSSINTLHPYSFSKGQQWTTLTLMPFYFPPLPHTHTRTAASHCRGLLQFHQPALYIFICHSVYIHRLLVQWISSVLCCSAEVRDEPSWYVLYIFLYVSYTSNIQKKSGLSFKCFARCLSVALN